MSSQTNSTPLKKKVETKEDDSKTNAPSATTENGTTSSNNQPTETFRCYTCLKPMGAKRCCAKCHKRTYCSTDCQAEDWKNGGHRLWCGKAGELGYDFEIRDTGSEGKGLGVFALRDFEKNEKIMAERPIFFEDLSSLDENHKKEVLALAPSDSNDIKRKFLINNISMEASNSSIGALFLIMSRVNHECTEVANCLHFYVEEHGVKILVASRSIAKGDEITFSYFSSTDYENRMALVWGFQCRCRGCVDQQVKEKLRLCSQLDNDIARLLLMKRYDAAIRAGEKLIRLYDEFESSDKNYARTYYDLFQCTVTRSSTLQKARNYLKLALEKENAYMGFNESSTSLKFENLLKDISRHSLYLQGR